MKKGTEYFSQSQRDMLAKELMKRRLERNSARKMAVEAERHPLSDFVNNLRKNEFGSKHLHSVADQLSDDASRILERAKRKNTNDYEFRAGSEEEFLNVLSDRERFSEFERYEMMRMFQTAKQHCSEIEPVRVAHPNVEPGGYILKENVTWGDKKGWEGLAFDLGVDLKEKVELSDQDAIFFHCHPVPPEWLRDPDYQTKFSMGDNLAVPYSRREIIFCLTGVVLGFAAKQYPYKETKQLLQQLRQEALDSLGPNQFEDDAGPIWVGLVRDAFQIKSFIIDKKVMQSSP